MIALTLPSFDSPTSTMTSLFQHSELSFHPILIFTCIPLAIIAYITHTWLKHERRRQSSMSMINDTTNQFDNEKKSKKTLFNKQIAELRSNPAAKAMIESNRSAVKSHREVKEQKEYLEAFPDLNKIAENAAQEERDRMVLDKELYWKLQNLEDHPGELT